MRLTKEQIEQIRLRADSGFTVDDDERNSLCDMALTEYERGLEDAAKWHGAEADKAARAAANFCWQSEDDGLNPHDASRQGIKFGVTSLQ